MKARLPWLMFGTLVLWSAAGCSVSDGPDDGAGGVIGDGVAEVTSDLELSSMVYNPDATHALHACTVSNGTTQTTMHCCPDGMVMVGAHLDKNVFKCALATQGFYADAFLDTDSVRFRMHACPWGSVMVGLHVEKNQLACREVLGFHALEDLDGRDIPRHTDSFPMHVCGPYVAMAGIHVENNWFICDG